MTHTYMCMCLSLQELDSVRERLSNKEKDFKDLKSASRELRYENEQLINKSAFFLPCITLCLAVHAVAVHCVSRVWLWASSVARTCIRMSIGFKTCAPRNPNLLNLWKKGNRRSVSSGKCTYVHMCTRSHASKHTRSHAHTHTAYCAWLSKRIVQPYTYIYLLSLCCVLDQIQTKVDKLKRDLKEAEQQRRLVSAQCVYIRTCTYVLL